jgi:signal recognition particle GTPase
MSDVYVRGMIADYFEDQNIKLSCSVGVIYRTVSDEIKRKNNYRFRIKSREDVNKKSISRNDFESILQKIINEKNYQDIFKNIETILSMENVPFNEIRKLKDALKISEIKQMGKNDNFFNVIDKSSREFIDNGEVQDKLYDSVNLLYKNFMVTHPEYNYIDKYEIKALLLVKLYV